MQPEVFELFATPVSRIAGVIGADEAEGLARRLAESVAVGNDRSSLLAHSRLLGPGEDAALDDLVARIGTHVQNFGELLLGETLRWLVKEIWVNVLLTGGAQSLHNHANSLVSGILYLTDGDESTRTVFARGMGSSEFVLRNTHAGVRPGAYDAQRWMAPTPRAGDLLLFPSYLLHEVATNAGPERISLAFNAIPHHLNAWGYTLSLQP